MMPEHCWSNAFLQWLEIDASETRIRETTRLIEVHYGTGVESAASLSTDGKLSLEPWIVPSHGGFEPYTLAIQPGPPGEYVAFRR